MPPVRGDWDEAELQAFLEAQTIPVRLATERPDGSPWIVTLWYRYRDGELECATSATADLVDFLEGTPTVGIDVSTNEVPYRGVRGVGTATVDHDAGKELLADLVERYLGDTDSTLARWLLREDREEARIRIDLETCYTWDYGERMADARGE